MNRTVILASGSPRRKELLDLAGIPFEVVPSSAEEVKDNASAPAETVLENARRKAASVSASHAGRIVIGADTLVFYEGHVLGKPADRQNAYEMLSLLSGHTHQVFTGVCLTNGDRTTAEVVRTDVTFRNLTPKLIERYLDTGEYMDKAGAYGIQGRGCILVERLNGDYFNVVGLPISTVYRMLERFFPEALI